MGDMADYYLREEMSSHLYPDKYDLHVKHSPDFTWWRPEHTKKIKVTNMTTQHLTNSINMIRRRHGWREEWLEPLEKELSTRKINTL